jgi:hypothetical protein
MSVLDMDGLYPNLELVVEAKFVASSLVKASLAEHGMNRLLQPTSICQS